MIFGIVIVFILITISVFFYGTNTNKNVISFKESLDLTNIPVITFTENSTKLNFLIDTGSSESHISSDAAKMLLGTPIEVDYAFNTCTGSDTLSQKIDSILCYKGKEFNVELFVNESLTEAFKDIKRDTGVQIHGILGCDFLDKHDYIIDFKESVAYSKK